MTSSSCRHDISVYNSRAFPPYRVLSLKRGAHQPDTAASLSHQASVTNPRIPYRLENHEDPSNQFFCNLLPLYFC